MKKLCQTPDLVLDLVVVKRVLSLPNEHMAGCESKPAALGPSDATQDSNPNVPRRPREGRACVEAI